MFKSKTCTLCVLKYITKYCNNNLSTNSYDKSREPTHFNDITDILQISHLTRQ